MNVEETREERAFREQLRGWLDSNIDPDLRLRPATFAERLEADRQMASEGLIAVTWPVEYGGRGTTPSLAAILDDERARAGIPAARSPSRLGVHLLGPTLMRHGSPEQQREFLPPILRAEQLWCQGFSEPDAGSDLANARCFAEHVGSHLVLRGTKIWTTQAMESDWCFALVRTTANATPKHRGLTFVLVSMAEPGIDIRPLVQLTGDAEFSQVFFDDVRVETANVVGEAGGGWTVAMTTLSSERTFAQLSRYRLYSDQLARIAQMIASDPAAIPDGWLSELGVLYADLTGIRNLSYKIASLATAGRAVDSLSSITKLWWSNTHQRLLDLGLRVATRFAVDEDEWYRLWLDSRAETIYAGSSEIQRNIIAERQLGLPR